MPMYSLKPNVFGEHYVRDSEGYKSDLEDEVMELRAALKAMTNDRDDLKKKVELLSFDRDFYKREYEALYKDWQGSLRLDTP